MADEQNIWRNGSPYSYTSGDDGSQTIWRNGSPLRSYYNVTPPPVDNTIDPVNAGIDSLLFGSGGVVAGPISGVTGSDYLTFSSGTRTVVSNYNLIGSEGVDFFVPGTEAMVVSGYLIGSVGQSFLEFGSGVVFRVPSARVTQVLQEIICTGLTSSKVTQDVLEVFARLGIIGIRSTQATAELVMHGEGFARFSQQVQEIITHAWGYARITQAPLEIIASFINNSSVRITSFNLECASRIYPPISLPTTTTTTSTTTTSTTSTSTSTSSSSSSSTTSHTYSYIPVPEDMGTEYFPIVIPVPPDIRSSLVEISNSPAIEFFFDQGEETVGVTSCEFYLGSFSPFDQTSRSMLAIYVPPRKSVGGPG
jgi:hypothetical protein